LIDMRIPNRNSDRGFTLIELILVLALIAIVIGIALPSLSGFASSQSVGDSADRVMALARWARLEAITRGVSFRLNFDPVTRTYWLTMQNGASFENVLQDGLGGSLGLSTGSNSNTTQFGDVGEEHGRKFQAPEGVTFDCIIPPQPGGPAYMEFYPSGRCDPGTIVFRGARGQAIEVGCLTGTEQFHVLSEDEQNVRGSMVVPPAPAR
jgi:prepilin-type N-terminal cleavage/methylation domain-containing protein